ncbi:5-oxoprolinase subunit C family protein [Pedobacter cryophilus]|uniref:Biotin-dependent carboxyltransferase family protein n=1 Tax=Pedobacter cryophilus TaxID=2571271 RepID=A0A4U1C7G1_9SPHI|nr:biotin-dependent carboxyltransferase family protein [Pedobacter cryophilus]TKC00337.1 biotin-dependent carboxyltransferase family protein [Pedobacter cryophilus]
MRIRIKKPGLLSTIQDAGRIKFLAQAVPISGALDQLLSGIANKLLGNADNDAVIEFTYGGILFTTETDCLIALVGLGAFFKANEIKIPLNRPVFIPKGTQVFIENNTQGSHSYLAVAGGWNVPEVLGSKSTFLTASFGGFEGRQLQENDVPSSNEQLSLTSQIILAQLQGEKINYTMWSVPPKQFLTNTANTIRVILGREFEWFDESAIADFLTKPYQLTANCNRMGYHLDGPVLNRKNSHQQELLSTAVAPGIIQVTGSGALILLMADCQTTGGYPRIAKVAEVDMPLCAQLKPGDLLNFEPISMEQAEILYLNQEKDLRKLNHAIQFKFNII